MTIKLISEFWRNQEIHEKIRKTYEKGETVIIPDLSFIPDFIFNFRILPSRAPTNHPMILPDILCLADLNGIFS